VESLDVDAHKLTVPLNDIVDTVEIMLWCCDEDALLKEITLKQMLTLSTTM
jgi:hypothetical protein